MCCLFQAQQSLQESSRKLDLLRLSLDRRRKELPPGETRPLRETGDTYLPLLITGQNGIYVLNGRNYQTVFVRLDEFDVDIAPKL